MTWYATRHLDQLAVGTISPVEVEGERLLLCRTAGGSVHVIEDCCSHDGAPLADGALDGTTIQCARHGARFDLTNGAVLRMPATSPLTILGSRVSDTGVVEIELED